MVADEDDTRGRGSNRRLPSQRRSDARIRLATRGALTNLVERRPEYPIAILCGGLGTRLLPLTTTIPKALVPVLGRPFIDHQLALLADRGLRRVVLCVGHLGEMIEAHVGNGRRFNLDVRYSYDGSKRLGTAGAVRRALPLLDDAFFITFGDAYLDCNYSAIAAEFERCGADGLMTVFHNCSQIAPSNVRMSNGQIRAYEKTVTDRSFEFIDYGVSVYRARAFGKLRDDETIDLASVNRDLLSEGALGAYEVAERFYEVGSAAAIVDTEEYLSRMPLRDSRAAEQRVP